MLRRIRRSSRRALVGTLPAVRAYAGGVGVRMSWAWEVDGMAGADFATVDEAVTSLTQSVEQAASRFGTERQQEVVRSCVIPMSDRMRTEGALALAEGRRWFGECQGLYVRMNPGKGDGR